MKKLFVYSLFLISFVSYGQEVTTSSPDSVATATETAGSNQDLKL